ncbi:hypothetical protein CONLIGDRAFT_640304 [Coniochaeta ligniaria NRRL 30616]|uniref:Uncharacterized protein n=1 Tax=Coniochaeta ligniaria NRRL 30616 TaxID=1408157 RepID=A0A1J7J0Y2_9PEZI|nr:hypothetical protein CONLIGDRAFT_640304 [Coniochaeta ligniaria NRRL 30616]
MCILVPTYWGCGDERTGHGYIGRRPRGGEPCLAYPDCMLYTADFGGSSTREEPQFRGVLCPECVSGRGRFGGEDLRGLRGDGTPAQERPRSRRGYGPPGMGPAGFGPPEFGSPRFGPPPGGPPGYGAPGMGSHRGSPLGFGPPGFGPPGFGTLGGGPPRGGPPGGGPPGYGPPGDRYDGYDQDDGYAESSHAESTHEGRGFFGGMRLPPCPFSQGGHGHGHGGYAADGMGPPPCPFNQGGNGHQGHGDGYCQGDNGGRERAPDEYLNTPDDGHEHCWHRQQ